MRPLGDLSWGLRQCGRAFLFAVRLAIQVPIGVPIKLSFQFLAISFQHSLQPVLRADIRGIPVVGAIQLPGQIPVGIAIAIALGGRGAIPLQAVQVIKRAPRSVIRLRSGFEGRHDRAIVSE